MTSLVWLALAAVPAWKLVWSDEFDKAGQPDPKKWKPEVGMLRNNEAQYYTDRRQENARIEGGHLVIEARQDNFDGHKVTSASLTTRGTGEWTYGKVVVRAKIPTGKGTWPAIWMLGTNIDKVDWPACGEIDIMENVGFDPDRMHFNVHSTSRYKGSDKGYGANFSMDRPYADWHTYEMEWDESAITFRMDGKEQFLYRNDGKGRDDTWPFHRPQYLILNLAIGGDWGGKMGVDDAIFPSRFLIDFVRVFQKS